MSSFYPCDPCKSVSVLKVSGSEPKNRNMMRVLFVTPFYRESTAMGGMAIAPALWAEALVSNGIAVDVFTTPANGPNDLHVPLGEPVEYNGVKVIYFPRRRVSGNFFFSWPMYVACRKAMPKYDVVHSIGLWTFPSIVSSIISRRSKIPYFISLHGMLMPWAYKRHGGRKQILMKLIENNRIAKASSILCTSNLEMQNFQKLGFETATIMPNVVSPPKMDKGEARARFRKRFKLNNDPVILFAGRLVRNKGVHLTIAAFQKIVSKYPKAKLVIIGPFEDASGQLAQNQVRELKLDRHVSFLGLQEREDYWDAVAGADLFVLNSYSENFGMAPAEAQSVGVPVLLSDQVGIAELVQQYQAGLIVDLNEDAIAGALDTIIADEEQLAAMGRNGIRLVQEQFSPNVVGGQFVELIHACTNK